VNLGAAGIAPLLMLLVVIGGALVLAGSGRDQLREADGPFRALVATAGELEQFEPGLAPG
jgi:hypothetical protein